MHNYVTGKNVIILLFVLMFIANQQEKCYLHHMIRSHH